VASVMALPPGVTGGSAGFPFLCNQNGKAALGLQTLDPRPQEGDLSVNGWNRFRSHALSIVEHETNVCKSIVEYRGETWRLLNQVAGGPLGLDLLGNVVALECLMNLADGFPEFNGSLAFVALGVKFLMGNRSAKGLHKFL